jgi:hypothetical protein
MQFLNKMASASSGPLDGNLMSVCGMLHLSACDYNLHSCLSNLQTEMAASNTLFSLVHSHRFHAQLMEVGMNSDVIGTPIF